MTLYRGLSRLSLALTLSALAGCSRAPHPEAAEVVLVAPEAADAATERTLGLLTGYFEQLTGEPPKVVRTQATGFDAIARAGAGSAVTLVLEAETLVPERFDAARMTALGDFGFALDVDDDDDASDGTVVLAAANTRLARQYAAYELLRRLGVRFYHPEEEYVPRVPHEQLGERARTPTALHRDGADYLADFYWRTWSFHLPHPLEHLESFSDGDFPIDEAERVNDWIVKNKGNRFRGPGRGIAGAEARQRRVDELEQLRQLLGFPRGTGIALHNIQQGGKPDIDKSSPVPVKDQIDELVTALITAAPDLDYFGIHFGPTELTVTPDQETVQWIDWAGAKALELAPGAAVEINNHITGNQPSPNYDDLGCPPGTNADGRIDYYDLAFHTDPRLGISVHTVMFYPLEGPADVYGQKSFAHKLCLMQKAQEQGRITNYFPEGSWWLSFDNPIPVYLPLYIGTRGRDAQLLEPLLPRSGGTMHGYRMFNSGQEWGYWQQDYAAGLWAWNADVTLEQALGELADPLCPPDAWPASCPARDEAIAVMTELIDHQEQLFLTALDYAGKPGGIYAYFAGEDDADVIAVATGIAFRPVRVAFEQLLKWSADDIAHFRGTDLAALSDSADAHAEWLARLQALTATVPEAGAPWLAEVIDGVAINELRARQTVHLYESVLAYREAQLAGEPDPKASGEPAWQAAQEVLADAEAVIRRREAAYRYPAAQTHGGGLTPETRVDNGTTYGYRVHTKTHLLSYWHNRNDKARAILDGTAGGERAVVEMRESVAASGQPLDITWDALAGLGGALDIGQLGQVDRSMTSFDLGAGEGYYPVSGNLVIDDKEIPIAGGLARAARIADSSSADLAVTSPPDPTAQGMIESVFPAIRWAFVGSGPESPALVFATDRDGDGSVDFDDTTVSHLTLAGDAFTGAPVDFAVPVAVTDGGRPLYVHLYDVTFSGTVDAAGFTAPVHLEGDMSVPDFAVALQELAAFDEPGAYALLSMILAFDPENPPATVPVVADVPIE